MLISLDFLFKKGHPLEVMGTTRLEVEKQASLFVYFFFGDDMLPE